MIIVPILALFAVLSTLTVFLHYTLPTPVSSLRALESTNKPMFSEEHAVSVMDKLSTGFGYRIVGTKQHVDAEDWLMTELQKYEGVHTFNDGQGDVQVEVWRQIGDGAHRFDFLSSVVWKKYYSMSNLIVRISDGTDASKANSVLVNSHIDSTLPSPGAADDGAGVGIMVELLRILTSPSATRKQLRHSVVLLFNNGEESFQDASHLFITSNHTTVPSIKAVVNLEACGVSGPELLFQAGSDEMVKAYSKAPYPFGTILANDIFRTNILLSDTDYRQFVAYGGVSGLDMAIVGNSYLYHTRKDTVPYVQPGVVQHFGENVVAIVDYLTTSPESRLPSITETHRTQMPIYFSMLGRFFIQIPAAPYRSLGMVMTAVAMFQIQSTKRADGHFSAGFATAMSMLGFFASFLGAVLASNVQALIMTKVMNRSLSWFSHEWLPIPLYGPPAIVGILLAQLLVSRTLKTADRPYLERATLDGCYLMSALLLTVLNAFGIGSSYLFGLGGITYLAAMLVNDYALVGWTQIEKREIAVNQRMHWGTYLILTFLPSLVGTEGATSFLDLFVPLTGRTGEVSPADHIIASIVSSLTFLCLPVLLPLIHRFGPDVQRRTVLFFLGISLTAILLYSDESLQIFDETHPQRLFVHQVHNLSSGEWWMNLGGADPSPTAILSGLADEAHQRFGIRDGGVERVEMSSYNPDFDVLYPVSQFITPYKFRLPTPEAEEQNRELSRWLAQDGSDPTASPRSRGFSIRAVDDTIDYTAGTRSFTLTISHPHIIWSVLAFDAEILEWDLPVSPPTGGFQRHHIKEVSRFGQDEWSVRMLLRLQPDELSAAAAAADRKEGIVSRPDFGQLLQIDPSNVSDNVLSRFTSLKESDSGSPHRLLVDYSGLWGEAMYPSVEQASTDQEVLQSVGVRRFREMDKWLLEERPEVDAMLLNVVAGVGVV
ncbi:hypothetical protein BCV69DRAFT_288533 [Microstroma glucosiphilum]|uniref:Peptide hydrolase n=1 Tax=Pseudomicrostroma glucosiphilum TaxID=1684307 RepID=A0A316U5M0_9BASI|nr:hypothetical protein BCV69DRAFT_288533 [Pseudomicrostroma glucosiphilum]PWN18255.1 hypothetical protein BCV69DRAFT_288533 [Pseudomicrostroma glucosiphilum]